MEAAIAIMHDYGHHEHQSGEPFTYTNIEIFLIACFVNKPEGMDVNLWDRPILGEFVAANRGQLVFLVTESQAARRGVHIESTLAVLENNMIDLSIDVNLQHLAQNEIALEQAQQNQHIVPQQDQQQVQQNEIKVEQNEINVDEEDNEHKIEELD